MCGVVGISGTLDVNLQLYDALTMLQHRGQDAAGIVTESNGTIHQCKGEGLARDVFHRSHMLRLVGNRGIGHVRYPTAGSSGPALAQPFYVNSPYGICIAHNGNLTNADDLREHIFHADLRHLNTDSDSEVLLNVFAQALLRSLCGGRPCCQLWNVCFPRCLRHPAIMLWSARHRFRNGICGSV